MSKRARRMNRRESAAASQGAIVAANDNRSEAVEAFTFGDPEPVLSRATMLDMLECWHNQRWYEPPVSLDGLARAFRASPHHSSAIILKRNMLAASLEPTAWMSRKAFAGLVQDYLVMGNAYVQEVRNRLGDVMRLDHCLAKYTRRGVTPGSFWWVPGYRNEVEFDAGTIHQLMAPDINQEIYGLPEYLSALQSALLNENATLFRRRYFENGSHAGYILYATGQFANIDVDAMRNALKKAKGPGNFRNMFVHSPEGKESGIKIIPIAEVGAKDEFLGIKNTTRDDVLAAHRVPPQLLGIIPANAGGFGDPAKALDSFFELEILPLQSVFLELNDQLGFEAVRFGQRVRAAE
ncbi:phage portal protein [Sphingobium limneticum]|uniref:Phage portal protein n=1 Tax=Sphingobium limneticum TaxID=1007511 RepID=A0A5J5IBM9_9SPHN|nr:phage portal protein [Sphingobium limneticum]KAA9020724.1 phage portal protein [Sphingobium limneticum]KAA9033050.1 phage portal protein [Sphingobium limneticum]